MAGCQKERRINRMIRIGLSENQKIDEINEYLRNHNIRHTIIFSDEKFFLTYLENINCQDVRQIGYKETIMYRTFYPLLEEIDDTYLLIMNECMRTQNRSELNYNCIAKYTNQTSHRIVFEYLPFIENKKDFMILLDFENSQKYKGFSIDDIDLDSEDVLCVHRTFQMNIINISLSDNIFDLYEAEKNKLFDSLGNKSPDTVPRQLHLWTGKYKKDLIKSNLLYVARNSRFKKPNITTYKNVEKGRQYILLDIPHRRLDFNDFLRKTEQETFEYISTGLSIDKVYINEFNEWKERLEKFYAKTGIYQ